MVAKSESEARFTSGPWQVIRDANHVGNRRVVSFHPSAVAKVYADEQREDDEKAIANAALISAAPDLAEATEGAASALTEAANVLEARGLPSFASIIRAQAAKCNAALSKALGDPS